MGTVFTTYIGPCANIVIDIAPITIDRCLDHNVTEGANYCPQCGLSRLARFSEYVPNVLPNGKWKEANFSDYISNVYDVRIISLADHQKKQRRCIYIPNRFYEEVGGHYYVDGDSVSVLAIKEEEISVHLDEFKKYFKEELEQLEKCAVSVEVYYGVVSYYI